MACAACTIACPANALTMVTDPVAGKRTWMLNYGRCVLCARCQEVCPTGAIWLSGQFELAVRTKADLMASAEYTLTSCQRCDTPFAAAKEVNYVIALLERAGVDKAELERHRAVYETCPECRRRVDFSRLRRTALVSGLGTPPASFITSLGAHRDAIANETETVR
jgi:hydrogenase-4 component H